jgi:putative addiction module component (TIGR02574 family)
LPFEQLLEVVKKLSPKEKLMLNDAIWDEEIEIPVEQQDLVRNRIKEVKNDPNSMVDWEEVKSEI